MNDREFILALKARCEKGRKSFEDIANEKHGTKVKHIATGNSTAYREVVKMIDVYLEEQDDENIKNNSR